MDTRWRWSEDGCQLLDDKDGHTVLKIRPSPATQEEFDLIAAAPDLLAACEQMLAKFDSIRPDDSDESAMCRKARAAIRKAKGQS